MWQHWVNALLGLWIVAIPFVGFSAVASMWALIVTGAVIVVLGVWGASEESAEREHSAQLERRLQHQHG